MEKPTGWDLYESQNEASRRVLLAEQDENISRLFDMGLSRKGFRLEIAKTGAAALDLARREPFDLAILAADLPDIDGLILCSQFKADPVTKGIPIIIWSSRGNLVSEALSCGAIGCGEKTGGLTALDEYLHRFCKR